MSKRTARLFVYKAKDGWRWRLKSANGKIICESGESYRRRITYEQIETIFAAFSEARWHVVTQ